MAQEFYLQLLTVITKFGFGRTSYVLCLSFVYALENLEYIFKSNMKNKKKINPCYSNVKLKIFVFKLCQNCKDI